MLPASTNCDRIGSRRVRSADPARRRIRQLVADGASVPRAATRLLLRDPRQRRGIDDLHRHRARVEPPRHVELESARFERLHELRELRAPSVLGQHVLAPSLGGLGVPTCAHDVEVDRCSCGIDAQPHEIVVPACAPEMRGAAVDEERGLDVLDLVAEIAQRLRQHDCRGRLLRALAIRGRVVEHVLRGPAQIRVEPRDAGGHVLQRAQERRGCVLGQASSIVLASAASARCACCAVVRRAPRAAVAWRALRHARASAPGRFPSPEIRAPPATVRLRPARGARARAPPSVESARPGQGPGPDEGGVAARSLRARRRWKVSRRSWQARRAPCRGTPRRRRPMRASSSRTTTSRRRT